MSVKKLILSLETTVRGGSISLLNDLKEIGFRLGSGEVSKASDILFEIEDLFNEKKLEKKDVRLITISSGYGSFTGARVGWALAKGLERSIGCQIKGVPLLEAMCEIEKEGKEVIVCIPNGKREVYFQEFVRRPDQLKNFIHVKGNQHVKKIQDFKEFIKITFDKTIIIENYLYEQIFSDLEKYKVNGLKIVQAGKNLSKYIGIIGLINASDNETPNYSNDFYAIKTIKPN